MTPNDLPLPAIDAAEQAFAAERWASTSVRLMYAIAAAINAMERHAPDAAPQPAQEPSISDEQIKRMVDRFLCWRLPESFSPDAGITFQPKFNIGTPWEMRHEPVGTNLFDAGQAEEMICHLLEALQPKEKS